MFDITIEDEIRRIKDDPNLPSPPPSPRGNWFINITIIITYYSFLNILAPDLSSALIPEVIIYKS